jgi:hypothetical protein
MHSDSNSLESKIVLKLKQMVNLAGLHKLERMRTLQTDFLANAIFEKYEEPYRHFVETCEGIFNITGLSVFGDRPSLPKKGVIVITNHLGINKLTKVTSDDLKRKIVEFGGGAWNSLNIPPLVNDDPFVLLFAPVVAAIKKITNLANVQFIFVCMRFPSPYSEFLSKCRTVLIDREGAGQYEVLLKGVIQNIEIATHKNKYPIVVLYPEGGTSGKYNCSSPFSLLDFKDGYSRLANDTNLPILPLVVAIDSNVDFVVRFLDLIDGNSCFDVEIHRQMMQRALNEIT